MTAVLDVPNDVDIIDPLPDVFTLSDGTTVSVEHLQTRQFFRLMRIITQGAAGALESVDLSDLGSGSEEDVTSKLLMLVLFAIPEAENASLDFLKSMVKPVGLVEPAKGRKLSAADRDKNVELWAAVDDALFNPEIADTVGLVEMIIRRESGNLTALGKQISQWLPLATKTGQTSSKSDTPKSKDNSTQTE